MPLATRTAIHLKQRGRNRDKGLIQQEKYAHAIPERLLSVATALLLDKRRAGKSNLNCLAIRRHHAGQNTLHLAYGRDELRR